MAEHDNKSFSYPPLSTDVDALRILTLAPGRFSEPLICTLESVSFLKKPKYFALSYTWEDSHPDTPRFPAARSDEPSSTGPSGQPASGSLLAPPKPAAGEACLVLNGESFRIRHNLHLALLHLRSPTQLARLWVDAVCINQVDIQERNWQVSLMSHIYARAIRVISWVGVQNYRGEAGVFNAMAGDWATGDSQHAAVVAKDTSAARRYSPEPPNKTIVHIAESAYWTRLWIVQETCRPRLLDLAYGANVWDFESVWEWAQSLLVVRKTRPPAPNIFSSIERVAGARKSRLSSRMTLENLIERFSKSECSELQDRVFGLLGCAIDIQATASESKSASSSANEQIKAHSDSAGETQLLRRNMGSFRVDYSRSFYDIWASVVNFSYFQADEVSMSERILGPVPDELVNERRLSIVRTAGVVQEALRQKVAEECASTAHDVKESSYITAMGYIAGTIVRIGPRFSSLIGSLRAQQDWERCWVDFYKTIAGESTARSVINSRMERLRWIDEEYTAKLLHCDDRAISRIRDIHDSLAVVQMGSVQYHSVHDGDVANAYLTLQDNTPGDHGGPNICVGTDNMMGLVPPAARPGDVVVRFWNCNAAVVMRPKSGESVFSLVGVADVAEVNDRKSLEGRDLHAEQCMNGKYPECGANSRYQGMVHVDFNLKTLQAITAYTDA